MAQKISSAEFPGADQGDNRADAARHCLWQAFTTEMANEDFALRIANAHEQDAPGQIVPNPVGLENEDGNDLIILRE